MTAGEAVGVGAVGGHEPVARVVSGVGAEAVRPVGSGERPPGVALRLPGRGPVRLRQIAEPVRAAFTQSILEIKQLPAVLAFEQLHRRAPMSISISRRLAVTCNAEAVSMDMSECAQMLSSAGQICV